MINAENQMIICIRTYIYTVKKITLYILHKRKKRMEE